jgi:hypothetical protein
MASYDSIRHFGNRPDDWMFSPESFDKVPAGELAHLLREIGQRMVELEKRLDARDTEENRLMQKFPALRTAFEHYDLLRMMVGSNENDNA